MSQPTIVLVCPTCTHTFRTKRETRPGARMRCPKCHGVFRFFVHGNGAVELRPVEDEPEPATASRLPPRQGAQEETKRTRTIFTSRRRNRAIGGYMPFEKTRSYLGMFAFLSGLGVVSLSAYVYFHFIDTTGKAMGQQGINAMNQDLVVGQKEHQEKEKRVREQLRKLEKLKKQPARARVEDGGRPGDQTHD